MEPLSELVSPNFKIMALIRSVGCKAGLDIVYMGLESGDSNILRKMRKGTNAASMIKAGRRIMLL